MSDEESVAQLSIKLKEIKINKFLIKRLKC